MNKELRVREVDKACKCILISSSHLPTKLKQVARLAVIEGTSVWYGTTAGELLAGDYPFVTFVLNQVKSSKC